MLGKFRLTLGKVFLDFVFSRKGVSIEVVDAGNRCECDELDDNINGFPE
jgi:hypothetical protein